MTGPFISVKTVSTYKTRLFIKMHMRNPTDLVRYAISHQLFGEPGPLDSSHPTPPKTGN